MAKLILAAATLLASANAFTPAVLPSAPVSIHASSTSLGMAADESGSKRKRALKVEILVFERQ